MELYDEFNEATIRLLNDGDSNERDDELREEMVFEEDDCDDGSIDDADPNTRANFGNCSLAEQLDPKL